MCLPKKQLNLAGPQASILIVWKHWRSTYTSTVECDFQDLRRYFPTNVSPFSSVFGSSVLLAACLLHCSVLGAAVDGWQCPWSTACCSWGTNSLLLLHAGNSWIGWRMSYQIFFFDSVWHFLICYYWYTPVFLQFTSLQTIVNHLCKFILMLVLHAETSDSLSNAWKQLLIIKTC